jgi:hypothetical protein
MFHKDANHEHYLDMIKTILNNLEAHDEKALDTAINRLRLEVITRCKQAIIKCDTIRESK